MKVFQAGNLNVGMQLTNNVPNAVNKEASGVGSLSKPTTPNLQADTFEGGAASVNISSKSPHFSALKGLQGAVGQLQKNFNLAAGEGNNSILKGRLTTLANDAGAPKALRDACQFFLKDENKSITDRFFKNADVLSGLTQASMQDGLEETVYQLGG
ncbi:MAG: hypothetical protein FWD46_01920 [Cystobacterineae bacterium]|nr:hypothetical protein [Cystobacterineae bacterium]